jgi:hypothetical protein
VSPKHSFLVASALFAFTLAGPAAGQEVQPPALLVGTLPDSLSVDGVLNEPAWMSAAVADAFAQADPAEGEAPSGRTMVRVLAGTHAIAIGIVCEDPDPSEIVSFSVRRDAPLTYEDHVRIVIDSFLDGRSGYVFAVNPSGARYDALINPGDASENADWDGIWEAATKRTPTGWVAEIRIPTQTLAFRPGLREWHFNVQRRIQRLLETDRWAFPARQYLVTQTSRAGMLTGLPAFSQGLGLSIRPAMTAGGGVPAPSARVEGDAQPSLDVTQRVGTNVLASLTVNTDFAETEVDTRRTNLTRFPLFFPEKRTFFLEGANTFAFGLGLEQDIIPFFSRRIGLINGVQVPIIAGGKVNGQIGQTNVGGLVIGTNDKPGVVSQTATMGVARVKQNIWKESWIGAIATTGDPLGRSGSALGGVDFTYATSRFRGNKNLRVGTWGLLTARDDLLGDRSAAGVTVSYPNDKWEGLLEYKRIGPNFDPSLGFVPRPNVQLINIQVNNHTRISRGPFQQLTHEFQPFIATDLAGRWESYRIFMAPLNWRFRTGDRIEFNVIPTGERLLAPFTVSDVTIAPGAYQWRQYRFEISSAQKRRLYNQLDWMFGGFYGGKLDQVIWTGAWNPTALFTVEFTGERDMGRLPTGDFTTTLVGNRLRINLSPDLSVASYVQYDTQSRSVGTNTRLRWTFRPVADLFVVYNHNIRSILDRWRLDSNQFLIKLQYALRY